MSITIERRGAVTVITMDRPEKRNAFDSSMTQALDEALNTFEDDAEQLVAVLTGGPKFFSAGTDIKAWAGPGTPRGGPYGIAARKLTKPVIAAVEGFAAGGGFEIALSTTTIVSSRTATFSFPEVGLGLVAECGGLFRGPRAIPLNVARELILTGLPLPADRAYSLGLVSRLTEPGGALEGALELAEVIARRAPLAVRSSLAVVEALYQREDQDAWRETELAKTIVRSSQDHHEGIAAFKAKREPVWLGS